MLSPQAGWQPARLHPMHHTWVCPEAFKGRERKQKTGQQHETTSLLCLCSSQEFSLSPTQDLVRDVTPSQTNQTPVLTVCCRKSTFLYKLQRPGLRNDATGSRLMAISLHQFLPAGLPVSDSLAKGQAALNLLIHQLSVDASAWDTLPGWKESTVGGRSARPCTGIVSKPGPLTLLVHRGCLHT